MSKTNSIAELDEPEQDTKITLPTLWKLWYHYGSAIPQTLVFAYEGMMTEASIRARKHCEIMGYRFIKLKRAIVDLEDREYRKMSAMHSGEREHH